jgi:hypothetical protein
MPQINIDRPFSSATRCPSGCLSRNLLYNIRDSDRQESGFRFNFELSFSIKSSPPEQLIGIDVMLSRND